MISGLTMVDDFTGGGGGGGGKVEGGKFERGTQPQDTLPVVPFQSTSAAALEAGQANEKPEFANTIVRVRSAIRAPAGEALGSMILVLFGLSVQCQVMLSKNPGVAPAQAGEFLSIGFGWGTGLALGVWLTGGASGGHISPVVTIAMAIFRGFSWRRVPVYILAQLFGAWFGAIIVYANYFHAIDIVEGGQGVRTIAGTAGLFALYTPEYVPAANAFFNEFLCSFLLMIAVFSVTDNSGGALPLGLAPMILFIVVLTISQGFGLQTGAGISPARDLGPRIMTSMVGYGQDGAFAWLILLRDSDRGALHAVFNYRDQFWLWCMQAGPLAGGLIGAIVYDLLIFVGPQSPFNKPCVSSSPLTSLSR
ncbi:aquaporin-like protein [Amylostereum chailletii]|nr:aquaporin-like protein [Amylostereum chailletii]